MSGCVSHGRQPNQIARQALARMNPLVCGLWRNQPEAIPHCRCEGQFADSLAKNRHISFVDRVTLP
jgi:hypothetical protein